jgi:hypothetical protein
MKGFPTTVDGPMGEWYKKVNAVVEPAMKAVTESEIRELLGEPDELIVVPDDERRDDETSKVSDMYPDHIFIYNDPYR